MIVTLAQGMLFNENHAKKVSHNSCHSPCMMDFYALLEAFRGVLQSKCVLKKRRYPERLLPGTTRLP